MGEQAQGAQILLVDDDADRLALCERWLNAAGYQAAHGGTLAPSASMPVETLTASLASRI
jgi:DNA-binding NtrC family response regulator